MIKKRYLFLILIVCLFAVSAVSGAEIGNDTNMLENSDDSGLMAESVNEDVLTVSVNEEEIQGSADNGTFTALQKKINEASEGSIISFENNYAYDSGFSTDGIIIDKALTINGNGHVIDALGQSRIFKIISPTVTLNDITFKNGYSSQGGAIYFRDSVSNSTISGEFINNNADYGSAIYFNNDVSNSTISGEFIANWVNSYSDVGDGHVGTIYFNNDVSNCNVSGEFINNKGGAIHFDSSVSNSSISGEFINNTAYNYGDMGRSGVIYFRYSVSNCNVSGEFINNKGGAIYFGDASNSNIFGKFINNSGGIYFYSNVFNSSISGEFINNRGGAIRFASGVSNSIISGEFMGNRMNTAYSDVGGGAIHFWGSVSNSSISGDFINNTAWNGGAIHFRNSVSNSSIFGDFINNTAYANEGRGGAIYFSTGVSNSSIFGDFINNTAWNGGAIHFSISVSNSSISGDFINNTAYTSAAICFESSVSNSSISGEFINNTVEYGDAICFYIGVSGDNVSNSSIFGEFINNKGGAIGFYIDVFNCSIINSIITDPIHCFYNPKSVNSWFGNNASNYESKPYSTCESWLFLDGASSPLTSDGKSTVVFTLDNLYNSSSKVITHPDISDLPDVVFELSAVNGYLDKYSAHPGENVIFTSTVDKEGIVKASYGGVSYSIKIINLKIDAPDVTKYYGGDERFVVTVTDNAGKPVANEPVKVTINGQVYDRKTGADGRTTFAINLRSGSYEATTEHDGDVIKSTITVKTTVISKDITKIFRNGTNYEASFLDKKGNKAPAGEKVSININGMFYQRTIKDDGSISFALNLEQGTYVLTMTNPYTGEEISNTVTILPNIVENKDLTKYYRNGSQFTFKLLDDKGNPAAGQKASININGVFYTRTTNDKGIATFQINLEPGTYILTIEYKGCRVSNRVTVLSILEAKDLNMKYKDGSKFEAKLVDGQGKPFAGQKITFNINGVFYDRTTDENGIARLNINLQVGNYIITSTFNGLNIANTIKIADNTYEYITKSGDKVLVENGIVKATYSQGYGRWEYGGQYSGMTIEKFIFTDDILSKYGMSDYSAYLLNGNPEIPDVDVEHFRYDGNSYWYDYSY